MEVRKIRHQIEPLLDKKYWKLEYNTDVLLTFKAITPLPRTYEFVQVISTETGFELIADGDIWQDLKQDLEKIYDTSKAHLDLKTFIGKASFVVPE